MYAFISIDLHNTVTQVELEQTVSKTSSEKLDEAQDVGCGIIAEQYLASNTYLSRNCKITFLIILVILFR